MFTENFVTMLLMPWNSRCPDIVQRLDFAISWSVKWPPFTINMCLLYWSAKQPLWCKFAADVLIFVIIFGTFLGCIAQSWRHYQKSKHGIRQDAYLEMFCVDYRNMTMGILWYRFISVCGNFALLLSRALLISEETIKLSHSLFLCWKTSARPVMVVVMWEIKLHHQRWVRR